MTTFYTILSIVELAILIPLLIVIFLRYNKRNLICRFIIISLLILINLIQIPIELALEKPIIFTILVIVIWALNLVTCAMSWRNLIIHERYLQFLKEFESTLDGFLAFLESLPCEEPESNEEIVCLPDASNENALPPPSLTTAETTEN